MPSPRDQQDAFRSLLMGEGYVYSATLLVILSYLYGTEFFDWEPFTLRTELRRDLSIDIPDKTMDRIQAAITAVTNDSVFDDAVLFHHITTTMVNLDMVVDEWDEPTAEEIAFAFAQIIMLRGERNPETPLSDEVKAYAGVVLANEGFTTKPKYLQWANLPENHARNLEAYSDDPAMFQAIYDNQSQQVGAVDQFVEHHSREVVRQIQALPFNVDGKQWTDSLFDREEHTQQDVDDDEEQQRYRRFIGAGR